MFEASLVYPLIYFSLATVVLWIYIHQLCFFLLAIYTARRYMHRIPDKLPKCPGVSIIKPLMGCDACLRKNLLSHFTLEYPKCIFMHCLISDIVLLTVVIRVVVRKIISICCVHLQYYRGCTTKESGTEFVPSSQQALTAGMRRSLRTETTRETGLQAGTLKKPHM
ncbi:hypothetical protein AHF37_07800 [Paragonimus kellicotti]|nr:hypothetical protein AHF37_07800 [Paragonimus kellicotti]